MAGWAASGSRRVRCVWRRATPGSAGTMWVGAPTCTGCWDCAGCWCAPASGAATWPLTCWAGPPARSATTASGCTAIAPGCWRRSSTRPNRAGRACARPTGFGWARPAGAGAGTARTRRPKRARQCICTPWSRRGAHASRRPQRASRRWRLATGDAASWAGHEFGGARLGDARLSARLVQSAQHMAESPMRAITGAANGARALVKGHYRLIDQPADSAVTVGNILAPHRERTLRRMQAHDTVLCIQDGTRLNFTRRGQTQGLGAIGSNQTGAVARGLELHTTLAVDPDGVALGVLRAAFDAPAAPAAEAEDPPSAKPREERKSFRWIEGLRDCAQAAASLSETRVVCVMDREADFLDLFVERARLPRRSTCWSAPRPTASWAGKRRPTGRRSRAGCSIRSATRRPEAPPRSRCRLRTREGQQTGPQGPPRGARRRRDAALPAGGVALPRRRAGRTVGRARARNNRRRRSSRWSGSC